VFFADEVFPVKHLCALKKLIPNPRYFKLYGPTETNVCTFYEIPKSSRQTERIPFLLEKRAPTTAYMVPDRFSFLDFLPKTLTDKIDYQKMKELSSMNA
jgi:hypothetical protein